ncbi:unnamed protein product [Boreogadus saida]
MAVCTRARGILAEDVFVELGSHWSLAALARLPEFQSDRHWAPNRLLYRGAIRATGRERGIRHTEPPLECSVGGPLQGLDPLGVSCIQKTPGLGVFWMQERMVLVLSSL